MSAWHVSRFETRRRSAIFVVFAHEMEATPTDDALAMFIRCSARSDRAPIEYGRSSQDTPRIDASLAGHGQGHALRIRIMEKPRLPPLSRARLGRLKTLVAEA